MSKTKEQIKEKLEGVYGQLNDYEGILHHALSKIKDIKNNIEDFLDEDEDTDSEPE